MFTRAFTWAFFFHTDIEICIFSRTMSPAMLWRRFITAPRSRRLTLTASQWACAPRSPTGPATIHCSNRWKVTMFCVSSKSYIKYKFNFYQLKPADGRTPRISKRSIHSYLRKRPQHPLLSFCMDIISFCIEETREHNTMHWEQDKWHYERIASVVGAWLWTYDLCMS